MTVVIPEFVTAQGNVKAVFAPTIASVAAPTVAELTGTGTVDLTCYLMPDWAGVTATQAKGQSRRLCSKQAFDVLGSITRSIADLVYTYLPQAVGTDAANKVYTALPEGTTGYLVLRYGPEATTAIAAADKVDVIPIEAGARTKNTTGSDEFAPLTITQSLGATGALTEDSVVAA